jgi:trehalose/maltose hydrolase-like predicted phosphorylase
MDVNQTNHWVGPESDVIEGWPMWDKRMTFSTVAGFYNCQEDLPGENYPWLKQYGCESVISGTPHPLGLHLMVGTCMLNSTVDPKTISNYSQTLSFKDGLTTWKYIWSPTGCGVDENVAFEIEYRSFASKVRAYVAATELRVTLRGNANVTIQLLDILDGRSAKRSSLIQKEFRPEPGDYLCLLTEVQPDGQPKVSASISSVLKKGPFYNGVWNSPVPGNEHDITNSKTWDIDLTLDQTSVFHKFVCAASSDHFEDPYHFSLNGAIEAMRLGWEILFGEHAHSWNELMNSELITNYRDPATGKLPPDEPMLEKLQIAAVADRYYLMQNLSPEGGRYSQPVGRYWDFGETDLNVNGLSVGGLSSDTYGGMLFWDQDLWMFPSIAITNPEYALQIIKARLKGYEQAKANAQEQHVQNRYSFDGKAVLYPWTSGRFGNETSTGPAVDYQYHINTDIAMMLLQYRTITGNETYFKDALWPVVESVGHTIATLLVKDEGKWSIKNMTDPDEYANSVSDGAFTMASFSRVMTEIVKFQQQNGMEVNETWVDMAENVSPHHAPSGITKEYSTMKNDVVIKQAAVSLLTFPLAYHKNYTLEDKRKDLHFYSQKQTPDGPAMGTAIAAIAENLIAEGGCAAYNLDLQSKFPNYRAPWYQMSEQATDDMNENGGVPPAFPFLTGHGGSLQIAPFGSLGLDLTQDELTIQPSLPWPLKHLQIQDFWFKGFNIRAKMNTTHTTITWLSNPRKSPVVDVNNSTKPMVLRIGSPDGRRQQETYSLSQGHNVTVKNDMYWQNLETSGNLLQCRPTSSEDAVVPGHYPSAATDGNDATRWQPLAQESATLIIDLGSSPAVPYNQININWGPRPAAKAKVWFANNTQGDEGEKQIVEIEVTPSRPAVVNGDIGEAVPYEGNMTVHTLAGSLWTGRFVYLKIEGCNGCEKDLWDYGATVGEFEVIGRE